MSAATSILQHDSLGLRTWDINIGNGSDRALFTRSKVVYLKDNPETEKLELLREFGKVTEFKMNMQKLLAY